VTVTVNGCTSPQGTTTVTVNSPPVIMTHPASRVAVPGGTASFSVAASGSLPLYYQWYQGPTNGLLLAGCTTATLIRTNLQPADFTNYTVLVANACSAASGLPASLTCAASPPITSPGFSGPAFTLTFPTEPGPTYRVEYTYGLENPSWELLTSLIGTGLPVTVTDSNPAAATRFYRIRLQ
jgi:hypothetical protein